MRDKTIKRLGTNIPLGTSTKIPYELLGPPGRRGQHHYVLTPHSRTDEERLDDTAQRPFKVRIALSKLPSTNEFLNPALTKEEGGSYVVAPQGSLKIQCEGGTFVVHRNARGELSLIEFDIVAESIGHAYSNAIATVHFYLDYVSYVANVPFIVADTVVEDIQNTITTVYFVSPNRTKVIGTNFWVWSPFLQLKPIYALYREAKNSTSDFWRFLCYYKILEGLLNDLRSEARKEAQARGIDLAKIAIPPSSDLPEEHQQYVGMSLKTFVDTVLGERYRKAVAHFKIDKGASKGKILDMSDPTHIFEYSQLMPISELCVRTAIDAHERLLEAIFPNPQSMWPAGVKKPSPR